MTKLTAEAAWQELFITLTRDHKNKMDGKALYYLGITTGIQLTLKMAKKEDVLKILQEIEDYLKVQARRIQNKVEFQ